MVRQDALEGWKTPLFGPYFHQTGYVVAATGRAPQKAFDHLEKALSSISSHPAFASEIKRLDSGQDFKKYTWQYSGPLTGFRGYFNRVAGYANSGATLKGIWDHCAGIGVKFVMGEETGRVTELLYADRASTESEGGTVKRRCTGVKTADGNQHHAALTIVAAGPYGASLIPSLGHFAVARCWSVAHVQLNDTETSFLRGIPTTNIRDLGFFFEPDPKTRLFKLCPLGTGYTNTNADGVSLPPLAHSPDLQESIPLEDEQKLRQLLRETFPWMAERPFVEQKLCWFADTADSEYCIDFVPDTDQSLVVLSGDSGHGFKMMPVFGRWVVDLLNQNRQNEPRWQWRSADLRGQDWSTSVSWRIGTSREICDLVGSNSDMTKARL